MTESTIIAFPNFISGMTGVSYLRVGIKKVWVTLTDGQTLSIPRKEFPNPMPDGNDLAFCVASLIARGPSN